MVRTLLVLVLLAAGCKSESAAKRETPAPTPAPAANAGPSAKAREEAPKGPAPQASAPANSELAELDKKVTAAADEVAAAQTDADRSAATTKLEQLKKEQAALKLKRLRDLAPARGRQAPNSTPAPPGTMIEASESADGKPHEP
ncbi:MAG: hypothetical protein SFX73_15925 [Kofleriaceae bacterium]|nr:hypothetical protein [Kofleriaceae bacterium]